MKLDIQLFAQGGTVTIGVELDSKDLDKQLQDVEKDIARFTQKKNEVKISTYEDREVKITGAGGNLNEQETQELQKLHQLREQIVSKQEEQLQKEEQINTALLEQQNITAQTANVPTADLTDKYTEIDGLRSRLEQLITDYNEIKKQTIISSSDISAMNELESEINDVSTEIRQLSGEEIQIKGFQEMKSQAEQTRAAINGIKDATTSIGDGIQNVTNKVIRWGLAIFSIRSAYTLLRSAVSTVSAQNAEIGARIEQIKSVVANALLPVIQTAINFVAKLMVYINYIFKALTGKNLFNFADATKKAEKNLSGGAKSARGIADNMKEARKQLAGFDEMNVLNDNVSASGGGGGAGGAGAGDVDFGNMFDALQKVKIPKWIQDLTNLLIKLRDNWQLLLIIIGAFAAALLGIKIAGFINSITKASGALALMRTVGIASALAGLVLLVGTIITAVTNWDKMTESQKAVAYGLSALGGALIAFGIAMTLGLGPVGIAIAAVVGAIVGMIALVTALTVSGKDASITMSEEERTTRLLADAQERLKQTRESLKNETLTYADAVDRAEEAARKLKEKEDLLGMSGKTLFEGVQKGTIDYKSLNTEQRELVKLYGDNLEKQAAVQESTQKLTDLRNKETWQTDRQSAAYLANTGKLDENFQALYDGYKNGQIGSGEFQDKIKNMLLSLDADSRKTFVDKMPNDMKQVFDQSKKVIDFGDGWEIAFKDIAKEGKGAFKQTKDNINNTLDKDKYKAKAAKFKSWWNLFIEGLTKNIDVNIHATATGGGGKSSAGGRAKGGIYYPKLAVGGVINQPGRGVPLGGAVIGERGAEGVIPLTDSQQMTLLGEAIGRYITVNASITNTMNGRVISRELKKVNNESNFAFNR